MFKNSEKYTKDIDLDENKIEKEPEPDKRIVFIRHPQPDFRSQIPQEWVVEGEDINTYAAITRRGIWETRMLSEYLENDFPWQVTDGEYSFYSSPVKRAERAADILETNIRLKVASGVKMPLPINNKNPRMDCFSEVLFAPDQATDEKILQLAKAKKIHHLDAWLDLEGENLLPRFQEKLADVRRGLEYLKQQNTKLDLVVSHGLTIAVVIWAMSNPDKYNDPEYKLTMDDLSTILNQAKIISCTSLTELDVFGDKTVVKDVALTPHLNKK